MTDTVRVRQEGMRESERGGHAANDYGQASNLTAAAVRSEDLNGTRSIRGAPQTKHCSMH